MTAGLLLPMGRCDLFGPATARHRHECHPFGGVRIPLLWFSECERGTSLAAKRARIGIAGSWRGFRAPRRDRLGEPCFPETSSGATGFRCARRRLDRVPPGGRHGAVRGLRERRAPGAGRDYSVARRSRFAKPLAREGRLGFLRWASMFLGVAGTYRQDDSVDVVYEADGRALSPRPPDRRRRAEPPGRVDHDRGSAREDDDPPFV